MRKSNNFKKELKVRCSEEEFELLNKRVEISGLNSLSRYLLESGLNVRGVQDWQERTMRTQLISSVIVLSNLLINEISSKSGEEAERIQEDLGSLNKSLDQLVNLHKTNLLTIEDEEILKQSAPKVWNYYEQVDSELVS